MNAFNKFFAEVVEILTTRSYEQAYLWIKAAQNIWKKESKTMFNFFFH